MTSSKEQGVDFDLVWTCEQLSYVRATRSKRNTPRYGFANY
jgi:hypothetical protein